MQYRTLGRTGLRVSEIGFGTVEIGMEYGIQVDGKPNKPDPAEAVRMIHRALDLGASTIDTARAYGDSERIVGQALKGRRDSVVLMTKVGPFEEGLAGAALNDFMDESLATSLGLLGTDVVDVYLVHSANMEVLRRGEVVGVLERYRREGKVRFVGATVYSEEEAVAAIDDSRIDVIQIAYSMLDTSVADHVLPLAAERSVGVVVRSVLHRGVLTPKGAQGPPEERRLHEIASGFDFLFDDQTRSLSHAAVRFVLSDNRVGCALLGMDSIEQVEENLSYADSRPFSAEQLRRARQLAPADPWAFGVWLRQQREEE